MKSIFKLGWTLLFSMVIAMPSPAQSPQNLVAGTGPLTNAIAIWTDRSAINLVSGNTLFPVSGKNTFLHLGFTQGDEVVVGGMVLYTTDRNKFVIKHVTPLTFGGRSSGAFFLHSACAGKISVQTPCVIQLDPLSFKASTLNDYYCVIYFTSDPNNAAVDSAISLNSNTTILGGIDAGVDDTTFVVGDILPSNIINKGSANFLVGVTTN